MDQFELMKALVVVLLGTAGLYLAIQLTSVTVHRNLVSDCEQLGGFRYDDKVYTCQQIRPNPVRPSTHVVPLRPEFGEGSKEGGQLGEGESSGRTVPW
jgi:hypothetical protein